VVPQAFSNSPAYCEAIRGLLSLHSLAESGQDDLPDADAIRDSLEQVWHGLSDVEKQRITGLSEDLYSLTDPVCECLPMTPEAERGLSDAIAARETGDSDQALELLRRCAKRLDPVKLSYERGRVWEQLGEREIAIVFYEFVSKNG
jgi:hypothetical protein